VAGTAHNGGEDGPGGVVSGETSLAHAGAIVNDQSSNFVVTHLGGWMLPTAVKMVEYTSRDEKEDKPR
jgi:hypothetical protein